MERQRNLRRTIPPSDQQIAYALTTYLACPKLDLGSDASVPDNQFECVRKNGFSFTNDTMLGFINPTTLGQSAAVDVKLSDVIIDLLTNVQYGLGFSSGDIGDFNELR